ncbi:MAG: hypothetical protein J6V33_03080 [Bacteroidales bacterium]|nr:hypothetical protein [Bacteroidales bacterium]
MTWKDVTTEKYIQIENIYNTENDIIDKTVAIISILFDVEYNNNMSLQDYYNYLNQITFLKEAIPTVDVKKRYGSYILDKNLSNISLTQFIDFKTYALQNDIIGCISVFLIPKGCKYLEGYNIEEIKDFIGKMSITETLSIYQFFFLYFKRYTVLSLLYIHLKTKQKQRKKRLKQIFKKLFTWKCKTL